ncbi:MBL fold metallo-hydrolase [Rubrobacter aplysinae]|uniref:MBL fold metallo-hydrolase n=1 Tax=Rubrobacter aplysinae TaxID=909625 RepID=UPI00064BA5E1|nr:MBL fold metallo-hydrolase [Rubrobacter aplysinae]
MPDPKPGDEETGAGNAREEVTDELTERAGGDSRADEPSRLSTRRPPENLPEELVKQRLSRLDTRRALADLCKSVPGLDELLLPRGIQADALTRKSGGSSQLLKSLTRRITQDAAAWGAFRTAVQEQIPSETFEAVGELSGEDGRSLAELSGSHTNEGLLLAAVAGDGDPDEETVQALVSAWESENQQEKKKASDSARVRELEDEIESLKKERDQLSFSSRTSKEQTESLRQEVEVLRGEREEAASRVKKAEEGAAAARDSEKELESRVSELGSRNTELERALEGERDAYAKAAERVEQMHEELGGVISERDRVREALDNARFTDQGFGDLLVRSVKNEVASLPDSVQSAARTARLMEFMGNVLQAHSDLRGETPGTGATASGGRPDEQPGGRTGTRSRESGEGKESGQGGDSEDSEHSQAGWSSGIGANTEPGTEAGIDLLVRLDAQEPRGPGSATEPEPGVATKTTSAVPKPRPMLSFKALGGAGEIGGSSHLLDFGDSRVLVDAGIKPDGRSPQTPDFASLDRLDAAVITHAHLDHCGALPRLFRDRPGLPVYCTPPSAKLIVAALNDHAAMGGSLPGGVPISEVRKNLIPVPFGKPFKAGNARVTFTESGHILGAASVLLESGSATTFHTGDICLEDHLSIPSANLPDVSDIDLLVMEATLADQRPQPFNESVRTMVDVINETTMGNEGSVLIPTYALGQAQEILLGLKHYGREYGLDREVFIYVDGSVVTTSERLYAEQLAYMKPYLQQSDPREVFFSDNIRAVSNDDETRERILGNPCAIVASPVTMQGGASAFYRKRLEGSPDNAVILPSNAAAAYANDTNGDAKWRVERVNFAAHCTKEDLMSITERLTPRQIILVHGSKRKISDLAHRLSPSHKIHTPGVGETVRTVL